MQTTLPDTVQVMAIPVQPSRISLAHPPCFQRTSANAEAGQAVAALPYANCPGIGLQESHGRTACAALCVPLFSTQWGTDVEWNA